MKSICNDLYLLYLFLNCSSFNTYNIFEGDTLQTEKEESCEKHPASIEWNHQKDVFTNMIQETIAKAIEEKISTDNALTYVSFNVNIFPDGYLIDKSLKVRDRRKDSGN
ncbi:hypothetical protein Tco_1422658 [Tanacetum coccineum]